jgi:hypothetical protein
MKRQAWLSAKDNVAGESYNPKTCMAMQHLATTFQSFHKMRFSGPLPFEIHVWVS